MPVPIKIANLAKPISTLLIVLLLNAGCKKSTSNNSSPLPAATLLNVSYASDPYNKMDIYLPEGRDKKKTRLLILIHGGSWAIGDKTDLKSYVTLAQEYLPGYAIANINYRLADFVNNKFPVQEEDVKSCVKYLIQYAGIYEISDQFVIFGESAGAHLGLLQAYKHSDIIAPIAAVDFYGPTDLKEMYDSSANILVRETLNFLLNGTPANIPDRYEEASPLNFVTADACPTIIFHGGHDDLVDTTQSVILRNRLKKLNVISEYVYYPDKGHGWSGETLKNSFVRIKTFLEGN